MERRSTFATAIAALAGIAMLLQGCTTTKSLRASWYLQMEVNEAKSDEHVWRIAIFNRSAKQMVLKDLTLNPADEDGGKLSSTSNNETSGVRLNPGQILVIKFDQIEISECSIPVAVYVRTKEKGRFHPIPVAGLPTFLSDNLVKCNTEWYQKHSENNNGAGAVFDEALPLRAHILDEHGKAIEGSSSW